MSSDIAGSLLRVVPLVCIHGTGGTGPKWEEELSELRGMLSGSVVRPIFPSLENPFQFCSLSVVEKIEAALSEVARVGERATHQVMVLGFSGGAQCAHRFVWRRPARVLGCVALGAGCWTNPDGTAHGMMVEEDWFSRPEWAHPEIASYRDQAAEAGWERVNWLVGCGMADHVIRQSSARHFHAAINAGAGQKRVGQFLPYSGAHVPPAGADLEHDAQRLLGWAEEAVKADLERIGHEDCIEANP